MDKFTQTLKTKYKKLIDSGGDKNTLRDHFVWEMMNYELEHLGSTRFEVPKPSEINDYLLDNDAIDDKSLELNKSFFTHQILRVKLSPSYKVRFESTVLSLRISLNDSEITTRQTKNLDAGDLAEWIIRQKHNLETYLTEWESVVSDVAKKAKTHRLVVQAVKALATEALRPYPNVQFDVFEQARRVKLMVRFLNCNLGINIYAYYGSYKKMLPPQLDDLKRIIEALAHNAHKTFFTYSS